MYYATIYRVDSSDYYTPVYFYWQVWSAPGRWLRSILWSFHQTSFMYSWKCLNNLVYTQSCYKPYTDTTVCGVGVLYRLHVFARIQCGKKDFVFLLFACKLDIFCCKCKDFPFDYIIVNIEEIIQILSIFSNTLRSHM